MAPTSAPPPKKKQQQPPPPPPPTPSTLPPPAFTLLYTRAKVYVHPTPYARDNVPGVLALLRDGAAPIPAHSLWLAFLPEAALPPRDDAFVHVRPSPSAPAAEQLQLELDSEADADGGAGPGVHANASIDVDAAAWREAVHAAFLAFYAAATRADDAPILHSRPPITCADNRLHTCRSQRFLRLLILLYPVSAPVDRLALTPPLPPEQHAFAFPLAAAHGFVLAAPTFSQWYGSVRVLFKLDHEPHCASVPLPTLFYHDDESLRTPELPPDLHCDPDREEQHSRHPRSSGTSGPSRSFRAGTTPSAAAAAKAMRSPSSSPHSSASLSRTSTPFTQRPSSVASSPAYKPPQPTWGGDELVTVLRRYTNVFRSLLQPGLILLNPSPETMAHHGSPYFEADALDRPARSTGVWGRLTESGASAGQLTTSGAPRLGTPLDEYDPGLDDIYRLDPYFLWQSTRSLVLTRFASLTQSARQASHQVLSLSSSASPVITGALPSTHSTSNLPASAKGEEAGTAPASQGASPRQGGLSRMLGQGSPALSPAHATVRSTSPAGASIPVPRVNTPGSGGSDTERGRTGSTEEGPRSVRTRMRDYLHIGLSPLSKPIQTFAQAGPVPMGPLSDAEWGRISQQGGVEFDSARTYLSHWARLVADAGERCRRTEEAAGPSPTPPMEPHVSPISSGPVQPVTGHELPHPAADEVEEEVGQLGVFELLARCPDVPSLPSTRARAVDQGPITLDEWNGWFEQHTGHLLRPVRAVKQAIFARGIVPDAEEISDRARREIWPFLLGVVDWDSTRDEREEAWQIKSAEYQRFKQFWEHDPVLLAREDVLDQRSLIRKDCLRTDRNHPLFRTSPQDNKTAPATSAPKVLSASIIQEKEWSHAGSSGNLHVARLGEILLTYGFWEAHQAAAAAALEAGEPAPRLDPKTFAYQPPMGARRQKSLGGYVQGMSDLCALLYIVLDGDEVATFWCFVHLMQRLAPHFFVDQFAITGQLLRLQRLLALMDPAFYAHLERADGLSLFFAYRWFLVGFRREFNVPDTLKLWDCMLAAEFTPVPRPKSTSARSGRAEAAPASSPKAGCEPEPESEAVPSRWRLWSRLAQVAGVEAGELPGGSSSRPASPPSEPVGQPTPGPDSAAHESRVGLTSGFSLFVALAIMQSKRDVIMRELHEFDDILAYINGLSHKLNVEQIIAAAEKAARAAKVLFLMRDAAEGKPLLPPPSSSESTEGTAVAAVSIPRSGRRRSSGPQAFSSGSHSNSCSAYVQVTRSSSGSGWSKLGSAERPPAAEDDPAMILVPPSDSDERGRETAQDACLHRVWEVDEEDFVVGLDEFAPPADAAEPPSIPSDGTLDESELEEVWAAQALARSKGAMPLCARIAEAEDLRELVL